jgi:hypothetical protein
MGDRIFTVADTSADEVTSVLKGTGSTDADVLYAATAEFGRPFRNQKTYGFVAIGLGAALGLTIGLVVLAIPLAAAGVWFWHKGNRNVALIDHAYIAFMASLTQAAGASKPTASPLNGSVKTG